jgi:hypothetical protein
MLASTKLDADFSAGCALAVIGPAFLMTYPHRLTLREWTPANTRDSKGERGSTYIVCPIHQSRHRDVLGHKLIDVVVVAVVYAVDVA